MITNERWQQAHETESANWEIVTSSERNMIENDGYNRYKPVLGLDTDKVDRKRVLDIGGGAISIMYHFNLGNSAVVDPYHLPDHLIQRYKDRHIGYFEQMAEDFLSTYEGEMWDEVWMYNCLQHVLDPEFILKNLYKVAPILRVGEPMDTGSDVAHPHILTEYWFTEQLLEISRNQRFLSRMYDYLYFGGVFELK